MMLSFNVPRLLPVLLPLLGIVAVLVADLVRPTSRRLPYGLGVVALIGSMGSAVPGLLGPRGETRNTLCLQSPVPAGSPPLGASAGECFWQSTPHGSLLQATIAFSAAVCLALLWPGSTTPTPPTTPSTPPTSHNNPAHFALLPRPLRDSALPTSQSGTLEPVEIVLLLAATSGALVLPAARDLGTWLVALELATLPAVALVALARWRAAANGAVQLLVTSVASFALLVLGVGVWFSATGLAWLLPDGEAAAPGHDRALMLAVVLLVSGLAFKLSLAPFHAWTPQVFATARTGVAAFLATVSKLAALAALLGIVRGIGPFGRSEALLLAVLAAVAMTLGNLVALRQNDLMRLLAWSTVAQAGWVVLPLAHPAGGGASAAIAYLVALVLAALVAFAVVRSVELEGRGRTIASHAGLWRRCPWRAGALALALLSFAGLPPGIIGLVAKVAALRPVLDRGWLFLALVAVVNVVLGIAVYLRWLRPMLLDPEQSAANAVDAIDAAESLDADPGAGRVVTRTLAIATLVLVAVSVQPELILRWLP